MLHNSKKWIFAVGLIVAPMSAMASTTITNTTKMSFDTINVGGTTYDNVNGMNPDGNYYASAPSSNFNQFSVSIGGVTVNVSAWADTESYNGSYSPEPGSSPNSDPRIVRAKDLDRNANGWSIENTDENPKKWCGYSHSADNFGCGATDYDFFLLDFGSQAVNLTGIFSSWNANPSDTQISVASLNAGTNTDLTNQTFNTLLAQSSGSSSSSFSTTKSHNNNGYNNYYADVSQVGASSSLWIVSAYNTLFGTVNNATTNNDGFKLAGISFSTTTSVTAVPEPSSIALLGLALAGFAFRSRSRK